jgi:hypothetical protein
MLLEKGKALPVIMTQREEDMDDELAEDILQSDDRTYKSRVERYKFFFTLPDPENGLWLNPPECSTLIEEAFWCYIEGQFVACVFLCQTTLENLFRALVSVTDRAGFNDIIEAAYNKNLISDKERGDLHALRTLRNQFTHMKPLAHPGSLWRQQVREGKSEDEHANSVAQFALTTMFSLLVKPPFVL